ncbi:MAG: GFA family protein [Xanthomonadales bacterium]|nr:GFA family protein [Xanthomonadales bacterium]
MDTAGTERIARCECGQLRLRCLGEPLRVSMCHCQSCQRRTGSVFGVQVRFRREQVSIEGESRVFVRTGDSGGRGELHFCPHCASTVFWFLDAEPELIAVAIGVIGDHSLPLPLYSVYESRRFPWTDMPALAGIEHYD